MQRSTLLTNAVKTQAGLIVNGPFVINGVLNDEELVVSLQLINSGRIILEQKIRRFDGQELQIPSDIPIYACGSCDVLAGKTIEGLELAIESCRFREADPEGNASARKKFHRQALVCSDISHENVVTFLGVFSNDTFPCACVFASAGKEDLRTYLLNNPGASRLKLLREVARGLHHIHDLDIVHGGIKGANIRIDGSGIAKIAGFASAVFLFESDAAFNESNAPFEFDMSRWCSPEIIHPEFFGLAGAQATKAIDIYAFGMLAYEIFAGELPFHNRRDSSLVLIVVAKNERPPRPAHPELSDELWEMIEKCWQREPSQRPTIQEIVTFLEKRD